MEFEKHKRTNFLFFETRENEIEIQNKISKLLLVELNKINKDLDKIETLSYIYKNIKG